MKLEDLNIGAVIMHSDRKENCAHAGEMWLVTKLRISKVEVICLNSCDAYRIGETGLILLRELPHYDLITTLCSPLATKPAESQKDLYIRWGFGKKTSLGKVGDKTPYKLKNGRNLFVGDVVSIKHYGMEEKDCIVVHDEDDGYYVMGIANDCNSKTGKINNFDVSLEKSFSVIENGDTFSTAWFPDGIEVVDFPPEESEDN